MSGADGGSTANGAGSDAGQRCPKLSARKQRELMDVIQVMVKKRGGSWLVIK
ncbi:hypothetical protein H8S21_05760 [Erwinia persicina]|uniref:hypothetical protein n=1 Tax=Erwinia persicina TaxID=55211 RepID=UPI001653F38A|nr:hypothetical protein [Erwinia persicina]MBC3944828.1 hypothetical protein [Erwinia persicina]